MISFPGRLSALGGGRKLIADDATASGRATRPMVRNMIRIVGEVGVLAWTRTGVGEYAVVLFHNRHLDR